MYECIKKTAYYSASPAYLDQEEGDSVGAQRAAQLDVAELGIDLTEIVELAVLAKNVLLNALDLGVLVGKELRHSQESWLVFGLVVVAVLHLEIM